MPQQKVWCIVIDKNRVFAQKQDRGGNHHPKVQCCPVCQLPNPQWLTDEELLADPFKVANQPATFKCSACGLMFQIAELEIRLVKKFIR